MSGYTRLLVDKSDGVGWLILNRPDAGNAFDALMLDELAARRGVPADVSSPLMPAR